MAKNEIINRLRSIFLNKGVKTSHIEYTSGNFDDNHDVIDQKITTITTELCEIGQYGDWVYMTLIISTNSFSIDFFNEIKNWNDLKIYGYKDFLIDYYQTGDSFEKIKKRISKEKTFQIQFNFFGSSPELLFENYQNISKIIKQKAIVVTNQLDC